MYNIFAYTYNKLQHMVLEKDSSFYRAVLFLLQKNIKNFKKTIDIPPIEWYNKDS